MNILILNGPNLNMLGQREPDIYGSDTLGDIEKHCRETGNALNVEIDFRQSNHEGELIEWIQGTIGKANAIGINAAGYTHTSVALHDALKLTGLPIAEIHLSDPKSREEFRHHSYIEPVASVHISGKGKHSYSEAIQQLVNIITS